MARDEELYHQIKQGDLSAFDVLYERYRLKLFRFIYSYLKNEQESEDVFHESFMKVFQSTGLDFNLGTFQSWVFEVARNLSLNLIRSQGRSEKAFDSISHPENSADAESLLTEHSTAQRFQLIIQKLSPDQKEVFNLKILGMPEKEIAKTLQIPLGTVKSRFHTIVNLMKQEVKE